MENNKEELAPKTDEPDEFIESSQVPTLRWKIRQKRPNYRELLEGRDRKKPPKRAPRDNRTVSQCIRQAWKNPHNKPASTTTKQQQHSSAANDESLEKEFVKFASQQQQASNVVGIEPAPSVSLFAQQEDALARYLFSETTEAQVDEQLQKLLDGFQAEYEKQCSAMESSPVHVLMEHPDTAAGSLQSTLLPGAKDGKIAGMEQHEQPATVCPLQPFISEQFLLPNFSEEIARVGDLMQKANSPPRTDPSAMAERMATPTIPIVELRKEIPPILDEIPMVTSNVCLDLSVQKEPIASVKANPLQLNAPVDNDDEWLNVSQKRSSYGSSSKPPNSQRAEDILDLRKYHRITTPQTVTNPLFARPTLPQRPCTRTMDCGTQTRFRGRYRNVGIQHRPIASLDFTDRNMIVLAQQLEADPILLESKLRRVAQTACNPIWCARDLSTVFTAADPYYANLKHFL